MRVIQAMETNVLYYGDNLEVLRKYIPDSSVDLIYLDPPFNSKRDYNIIFKEQTGEASQAQIQAFSDSWKWNEEAFHELMLSQTARPEVKDLVDALVQAIRRNDVTAYLVMMAARLIELRRVLKDTGSIYLHCDPTMSHYIKIVMDAIFGPANFRNEIVWKRFNFHADAKRFGRVADRLLFYTKSPQFTWNTLTRPFDEKYIRSHFTYKDKEGRIYTLSDLNPPGGRGPVYEYHGFTRPWRFTKEKMLQLEGQGKIHLEPGKTPRMKRYLDELPGAAVFDIWTDISGINSQAKERLGYETQKPQALLERIIQASSNPGEIVLDPFCGCGTAVVAAQKLGRRWIGIDITHLAITVMKNRLADSFPGLEYMVIGEPKDLASARALARQEPDGRLQFQYWAVSLVTAQPQGDRKRGADRGIDGIITFIDGPRREAQRVIVQVKSGAVHSSHIRDLKGVMEREKAALGLFITLEPPTRDMRLEAAAAGFYHSDVWQKDYPRIQILTIEELLAGPTESDSARRRTEPALPPSRTEAFAKAPRIRKEEGKQSGLEIQG